MKGEEKGVEHGRQVPETLDGAKGVCNPKQALLAFGAFDGEVRIWNVADGKLVKVINASPGYVPVAAPPKN